MVVRFVEDDEVQLLLRPLSQDSMSDGLPLPGSEAASQARQPLYRRLSIQCHWSH